MSGARTTWLELVQRHQDHGRAAARFGDVVWTGRQLLDYAAGYADWLDTLGTAEGEPIPALLATSAESLAVLIGGAGCRHPIAPLGTRLTAYEIAPMVRHLGGRVLVTQPEFLPRAREIAALEPIAVAVTPAPHTSARDLTAEPDDVAFVLHTAGTTGAPKSVSFPHWRLAARTAVIGGLCDLGSDSLYGAIAPFHHLACAGNIAVAAARGSAVTGVSTFSVDCWQGLAEAEITHTTVVPAMIESLLAAGSLFQPKLRTLQYGAAPIRPETLRRAFEVLPGVRMVNMFGQTEGSPLSVLTPEDHRQAMKGRSGLLASVGRAAPRTELRIAEPDDNGVGEVHARADHMIVVDGDGWRHSGDLGRIDDEGYLYLSGRQGDKIIRGGENVYPVEVEHVLAAHPQVGEAAVVGVPDDRLGQTIAAFIVAAGPVPPDPRQLHQFARRRLSGFKVPTSWHMVAELPRNAAGKLLRRELVRLFENSG